MVHKLYRNQSKKTDLSKTSKNYPLKRITAMDFGISRSYLFEYGLMLLLVGSLIVIVSQMFSANVAMLGSSQADVASFSIFEFMLSALIVILPLTLVLIKRTGKVESIDASIKNTGWRKAFLGFFLATISISAIIFSILFINSFVNYLSSLQVTEANLEWQRVLGYFFAAAITVYTAYVFGSDYRSIKSQKPTRSMRYYAYGLAVTSLLIGATYIAYPLREQRLVAADIQTTNDLRQIDGALQTYYAEKRELPQEIDDLRIDAKVLERADSVGYEYIKEGTNYKLCADFYKDGTTSAYQEPPTIFGGFAQPAIYPPYEDKLSKHKAGNNCFDFTVQFDNYFSGSAETLEGLPSVEVTPSPSLVPSIQQF